MKTSENGLEFVVAPPAGIPFSYLDTDTGLTANSNSRIASQKATKVYTDAAKNAAIIAAQAYSDIANAATLATAEAYADAGDAHMVKDNVTSTFTVGQKATAFSAGTKSSGTFTPDVASGNLQYAVNGGAFILGAPSAAGDYSIVVDIVNNASAGAITYSGWTRNPTGDALDTTNGHGFRFFITKINGLTSASIQALQ